MRALNLGEFVDGKAQQKLPRSLAAHEREMSHFGDRCHQLCMTILKLFALGLKVCRFITRKAPITPTQDNDYRSRLKMAAKNGSPLGTIPPRALPAPS